MEDTPPPPSASTSASTSATPTSAPSAADAAKARREARKARILSKGSDRLAKLTKQARGEEAELLYPSTPSPTATPGAAPSARESGSGAGSGAGIGSGLTPAGAAAPEDEDDPAEVDISHQARMDAEMERSMEMFRQRQVQQQQQFGGGEDAPQDPMQAMMAALMGGGPGAGGEGGAPQGMPDLSQLFAAMNGGGGQAPGQGGEGAAAAPTSGLFGPQGKVSPSPRTLFDRLFSLAHICIFLLLGYFAISSTLSASPALDNAAAAGGAGAGAEVLSEKLLQVGEAVHERHRAFKWASLAYRKPTMHDADYFRVDGSWVGMSGNVVSARRTVILDVCASSNADPPYPPHPPLHTLAARQPIFWLFLTLELLLQSSRILLFSRAPPPSSLLFSLASQLPFPTLQWTLRILARYASIASSFMDDVAVLVFSVGCGILWCAWSVASDAGKVGSAQGGLDQGAYAAMGAKA